jgi:hypothetical protein
MDFAFVAETMLAQKKKLFYKDGQVNKEGLVEFYKDLRRYPDLSDSDAAILAATKYESSRTGFKFILHVFLKLYWIF